MSDRKVDLDALFDRDADSRLLDRRRHEELGLAPHVPSPASLAPARFGAESIVDTEPGAAGRPAALHLSVEARPDRELIPGAAVTVVASVRNDGDTPIDGAELRFALPPEAEAAAGSFACDERTIDGESLLGSGLKLEPIGAGAVVRVRFALRVLPGMSQLDLHAHVSAPGVPAIAAPALRLRRRAGHAAYEPARPFFELETDEVDELAGAPKAQPPPRLVDAVLDTPALPAPPAIAAPAPVPVAAEPAVPAPAPAHLLTRSIDAEEVRALERLFAGAVPHGLATFALLSSLAAADGPAGEALGLGAFVRSIAASLPRALVAARIGRLTSTIVTPEALDALRPAAVLPAAAGLPASPQLVLAVREHELDGLRAILGRRLDDPFLRGAQVLLGIAPRTLEGVPAGAAAPVTTELARYRGAAGAWLMRTTVRRSVDRRFDPVVAVDEALQDAGRRLLARLGEALSA